MSDAVYTETIVVRTTPEMSMWIKDQREKLERDFGEGFNFSDGDVVRRVLYKEMRGK